MSKCNYVSNHTVYRELMHCLGSIYEAVSNRGAYSPKVSFEKNAVEVWQYSKRENFWLEEAREVGLVLKWSLTIPLYVKKKNIKKNNYYNAHLGNCQDNCFFFLNQLKFISKWLKPIYFLIISYNTSIHCVLWGNCYSWALMRVRTCALKKPKNGFYWN